MNLFCLFSVYFIACSHNEEINLYSNITNFARSTSIVFIFLRWSPHFASFYTTQFLPNTTSITSNNFFPILHLLPMDVNLTDGFDEIVWNYEQNILSNASFTDDVRYCSPWTCAMKCLLGFF